MRLITHNFLACNNPKCAEGSHKSLQLTSETIKELTIPFDKQFVEGLIEKIDFPALNEAAEIILNKAYALDATSTELKEIHHLLFEIDVIDGTLKCPSCERIFPISNGIPNMAYYDEEP